MKIHHKFKVDLIRGGITPRLQVTQSDALSRMLLLQLVEGGIPWKIPEGAQLLIHYRKSDRTGGIYDTLPDGSPAWQAKGNTLEVTLAPQVLTAVGETMLAITLVKEAAQLTTFSVAIDVKPMPGFTGTSENYSYVTAFLPQPETGAKTGALLRVSRVDSRGRVLATEAVSGAGIGLGAESSQALLSLLKSAVYAEDVSQMLQSLEEQLSGTAPTLTGITAVYIGGNVEEGTAVENLTGITVVAVYSDDSTATVTDYTLSGTIEEGENTVTVSYGGFTDTFTVTGTAQESGGDSEQETPTIYTVTNTLTNAINSNTATETEAGSAYSCTITAADGYALTGVRITMGGTVMVDKTFSAAPLESGWSVEAVTGDIVITATAEAIPVTLSGISVSYTGDDVEEGTPVESLTGITVTATYSDGSTAQITDYTLSGTIAAGENTVTVSYGGFTDTFTVTGKAVSYTLVNNWDFTTSLTDTVGGVTAVLGGVTAPTRDAEGVHFTVRGNRIQLTQEDASICGKRVEIDIASGNFETPTGQHARIFDVLNSSNPNGSGNVFTWRYNNTVGWAVYSVAPGIVGWGESLDATEYPITFFHGKTVRLDIDESGYLTLSYADIGSSAFTKLHTYEKQFTNTSHTGQFYIGAYNNNDLFPGTVSGARIYAKEV